MQKNKNRPGYTKTKAGWIPKNWGLSKACDLMDVRDGTHDTPVQALDGIPLVTQKNIVQGRVDMSGCYCISEQDAAMINKRSCVDEGDILMSMIGTVGESALVSEPPNFCIKNVGLFKSNEVRIRSQYLIQYFHSNTSRRVVHKSSNGGIQKFISLTGLRQLPIPLPSLPEQEAIAEVLECWDKAIRGYERKIEKKRKIKKGLMQRLLSGEQRLPGFDGEWKEVRLGDVADVNRESLSSKTPEERRFFYIDLSSVSNGRITCPQSTIRFGSSPSRARRLFRQHDVLMATVRPNLLGHGYVDFDASDMVCSTGFAVISCTPRALEPRFLYAYLFSERLNTHIRNLLAGSSYPAINASDVCKFPVPMPDFGEQQAIAAVLSSADAEIAALERKLAALREQKRFLLNNMVTGTIRLPQFRKDVP